MNNEETKVLEFKLISIYKNFKQNLLHIFSSSTKEN